MQRVLVTGGAGFIGSHTVDLLLREQKEVLVLDNLSSGKLENLDLRHPNLEFIEGDVLEYPLVQELLVNCDAVLHLAAITSVQWSMDEPIYTFQVNAQGFLHVLQAVRQANRMIPIVYASSAAVYGDAQTLPNRDDVVLSSVPISPYALHKINNEQYADLYHRLFGIKSVGLRYFNVYGSRQVANSPYSGVISCFLNAYKKEETLTIFGEGKQSRDFIHVNDVARANLLALMHPYAGYLNIATGHPQTILQLIDAIEAAGNHQAKTSFAPARLGDIQSSYGTTDLAQKQLGFKYAIPLEEGVRQLV